MGFKKQSEDAYGEGEFHRKTLDSKDNNNGKRKLPLQLHPSL